MKTPRFDLYNARVNLWTHLGVFTSNTIFFCLLLMEESRKVLFFTAIFIGLWSFVGVAYWSLTFWWERRGDNISDDIENTN